VTEIAELIRELGFPVAFAVALGYALYLVGKIGLNLLLEAWKQKDARLIELEQRVEQINNGQREALERRLDDGIAVQRQTAMSLDRVSGCLEKLGHTFGAFAENRPCLQDSDARRVIEEIEEEFTPDPEALKVVQRRKERVQKDDL